MRAKESIYDQINFHTRYSRISSIHLVSTMVVQIETHVYMHCEAGQVGIGFRQCNVTKPTGNDWWTESIAL